MHSHCNQNRLQPLRGSLSSSPQSLKSSLSCSFSYSTPATQSLLAAPLTSRPTSTQAHLSWAFSPTNYFLYGLNTNRNYFVYLHFKLSLLNQDVSPSRGGVDSFSSQLERTLVFNEYWIIERIHEKKEEREERREGGKKGGRKIS